MIVATHWFADANYSIEKDAQGRVIVTFTVRELPILTSVAVPSKVAMVSCCSTAPTCRARWC